MRWVILAAALLTLGLQGCVIDAYGPVYTETEEQTGRTEETVIVIEEPVLTVDTQWPIPAAVQALLAPYVQGYFTPADERYCDFLYYQDTPRRYDNHPSYVRGDLNADWNNDYAMLFTRQTNGRHTWTIDTRLLVALSSHGEHDLTLDLALGSVTGDYSYPVEEYWSLCKMPAGVHVYQAVYPDMIVEEEIVLEDDAFLLTSLETGEQDLFYAVDHDIYYMPWNPASPAKRAVKPGRTANPAPWRGEVEKRVIPGRGK